MSAKTFTVTTDAELLLVALALEALVIAYHQAVERLLPTSSASAIEELKATVARAEALLVRVNEARR